MSVTTVKERPILFSGPMVRAILDGSKTQTRRVIKFRDDRWQVDDDGAGGKPWPFWPDYVVDVGVHAPLELCRCPYGEVGDHLYVRETWRLIESGMDEGKPDFRADNPSHSGEGFAPWKPSIHMPRWASRILLEVTDVRVERVQDISEEDAKAEGGPGGCLNCGNEPCGCESPEPDFRDGFIWLWDSINEKRGFGWAVNPWVWCVSFKVIEVKR